MDAYTAATLEVTAAEAAYKAARTVEPRFRAYTPEEMKAIKAAAKRLQDAARNRAAIRRQMAQAA